MFVDAPRPGGHQHRRLLGRRLRVSNVNAEQLHLGRRVRQLPLGPVGRHPGGGDWDGDGTQTVGVVRPNAGLKQPLLLRNSDGGVLDFGTAAVDRVLVYDWNGDST